jgi:hypothetical protein
VEAGTAGVSVAPAGTGFCAPIGSLSVPCYWTGAILTGSRTATQSYIANEGVFNVPTLTPGGFGTNQTLMSIWTGLDNVFQPVTWAQSTSTVASYRFDDEIQPANMGGIPP